MIELEKVPDFAVPATKPGKKPVIIDADRIHGYYQKDIEAVGNAKLSCENVAISADRMRYSQDTEDAEAMGNVRVDRPKEILDGSYLELNLETGIGHLDQPHYQMKDGVGRGTGRLLLLEGDDNYRVRNASYTTCPLGNNDWFLRAESLEIDNNREVGTARNVSVMFKNVPILYLPWMDFSYSGKRKTGMLAPVFGNTTKSGAEISLPFYLNVAPNIDATITPRVMSKRGVIFNNELRYLGSALTGNLQVNVLPNDLITKQTRYGISFNHNQFLGSGWSGNLIYNKVSDNRFVSDLANNLAVTSRINLMQRAALSYNGAWGGRGAVSFTAEAQRFQTLQDSREIPLPSPFKRLPQLTLNAINRNVAGMDFSFAGMWTNFSDPTRRDGKRLVLFPTVSLPFRNAFGYITPKVGLHYTSYDLSAPNETQGKTPDRTLPIFSLDSGVVFDREMSLRGEKFTQTLEPRAFYVYIPFSEQRLLPVFDSSESDFSFAQILTENRFNGQDRINDANQITFALTSRLIEPGTGIERLRLAIGQQFRFQDQRVKFSSQLDASGRPVQQVTSGKSDFIAAISGRITSTISTDTNIQFDEGEFRTEKIRTGISYQPELGKALNIGYRFTRNVVTVDGRNDAAIEQVDGSIQWPFTTKLHGVARINYSLEDDKLLAGLLGFEYRSCCWALRLVAQRFVTATQRTRTAVFLQLELNDLMSIGINPLRTLQESIPGYSRIN